MSLTIKTNTNVAHQSLALDPGKDIVSAPTAVSKPAGPSGSVEQPDFSAGAKNAAAQSRPATGQRTGVGVGSAAAVQFGLKDGPFTEASLLFSKAANLARTGSKALERPTIDALNALADAASGGSEPPKEVTDHVTQCLAEIMPTLIRSQLSSAKTFKDTFPDLGETLAEGVFRRARNCAAIAKQFGVSLDFDLEAEIRRI